MAPVGERMSERVLDPDALAALEEQRGFLRRSLADLERERAAGDLDDGDYESLRDDYQQRLDAVSAAVEEGKVTLAAQGSRSAGRTALIIGAVVVFALVCGFIVAHLAGRRGSGDEATGQILRSSRDQLALCLSQGFSGDVSKTVSCYDDVLKIDPGNEEAKTYRAGIKVVAQGDLSGIGDLLAVAEADPNYPDVHAFLAVAFDIIGRDDSALAELDKLAALHPAPLLLDLTSSLRQKLVASTTTTPPTSAP
jgi:tetratricopeptide (TPR) repeat protein